MIGLVLALASSVAYGASDFLGGVAARRSRALDVIAVSYPICAIVVLCAALAQGGALDGASTLWGLAVGATLCVGMWAFYAALATGAMSIISPLTAALAAGLPLAVGVMAGDTFTAPAVAGVAAAIGGIILVTAAPRNVEAPRHRGRAVLLATLAGVCFGLSFVFTAQFEPSAGLWPLVAARVVAAALVLPLALAGAIRRRGRGLGGVGAAVAVGVTDGVANILAVLAFHQAPLSIAGVLISLYPCVTVALALGVLRERLARPQWLGIPLVLGSVVLLTLGS